MDANHCERRRFLRGAAASGLALSFGSAARSKELGSGNFAADELPARIPGLPILGNPKGDVTVAEFVDYRCSTCHIMQPSIVRLLQEDRSIRFIVMEWPILSAWSIVAAKAALAAGLQGRFEPMHGALLTFRGGIDDGVLGRVARASGVDPARLDRDRSEHRREMAQMLEQVDAAADTLGFRATPSLLIGDRAIRGGLTYERLKTVVAAARQRGAKL